MAVLGIVYDIEVQLFSNFKDLRFLQITVSNLRQLTGVPKCLSFFLGMIFFMLASADFQKILTQHTLRYVSSETKKILSLSCSYQFLWIYIYQRV